MSNTFTTPLADEARKTFEVTVVGMIAAEKIKDISPNIVHEGHAYHAPNNGPERQR